MDNCTQFSLPSCNSSNSSTSPTDSTPSLPIEMQIAVIAGCSLGGIFIVGIFCWIAFCFSICFRYKRLKPPEEPSNGHFSYSPNKDDVTANRNTLELEQYGRIQKVIYTPAEIKSVKRVTYVGAREVERADLILLRKIGNGNFGPVYRAKVWGIPSVRESRLVTAKLLLETADDEEQDQFQSEISVSSTLTHPNVVGLLGVCTKDKPECLLLDAGECIDLLQHIRGLMVSAIESPGLGHPSAVGKAAIDSQWFSNPLALVTEDEHDLLTYADQVCLGMAFLAESQHIHKDLATRNCIITPAMVVKVANFGIAQQLYPESYCDVGSYKSQPLRWMSPEAITHSNFTIENDIWGFGILLWELFTYGEFPYSDMSNAKVESYVCEEQKTLHKPEGCRDEVYDLMCMCWDKRSISRPSFLDLHEQIYKLIFDLEHMPRPS